MSVAIRCLLGGLLIASLSPLAQASMRCGNALIDEGQHSLDVLRICGEPDKRDVTPPSSPQGGGVTVEQWIYGPRNGVLRYLRFIDGRLVEIRTERG
ncbi:MAG: DUF2845 domain-containing protein [Pseudomonas sp.]|uniref:DUF2845 domain-containing protein n=1 Tax=Pseudomonas sp. TaxID=306 RepID=UPI003D146DA2